MVKSLLRLCCLLLILAGTSTIGRAADSDGDGLLDLLDVDGFDPSERGEVRFRSLGIEDLDGANQLKDATRLDLFDNSISSIERGDFAGMDNLESLNLSFNWIRSIEHGGFEGLTNLKSLGLWRAVNLFPNAANSLRGDDIFAGLPNLEALVLNESLIGTIDSELFVGLEKLQQLTLRRGIIGRIETNAFQRVPNLRVLSLVGNSLQDIEPGAYSGLQNLETLLLSGLDEVNLIGATFDSLLPCTFDLGAIGFCLVPTAEMTTGLLLDDAKLSLGSFNSIVEETTSITEVSLDGLTFTNENPADLSALLGIESLKNVTIGQELYSSYQSELDTFAAIEGNTLTVVAPDCNEDGVIAEDDLSCVATVRERDHVLSALDTLPGDLDGNGDVDFDDFLRLSANFASDQTSYADGNVDLMGDIDFDDFLILSANFGASIHDEAVAAVPEPASIMLMLVVTALSACRQRCRSA